LEGRSIFHPYLHALLNGTRIRESWVTSTKGVWKDKCFQRTRYPEELPRTGEIALDHIIDTLLLLLCFSIPRKFQSGAIGSLVHIVALHGDEYACDFEVLADGYLLRLVYVI
jgi:hypothetical protein